MYIHLFSIFTLRPPNASISFKHSVLQVKSGVDFPCKLFTYSCTMLPDLRAKTVIYCDFHEILIYFNFISDGGCYAHRLC